jgi:pyruvate formate lyase activating enzyme
MVKSFPKDPPRDSDHMSNQYPSGPLASASSSTTGMIFDIRKYTIHDGPGVRTTVFFKGCPLACAWCCNPESQARSPELVWVRERCLGCDGCLEVCPRDALGTGEGGRTIDRAACDGCGRCAERCPGGALNLLGRWVTVDEVLAEVARDALYFEGSGGGLTLSGGEPLAQPEFAAELLRRYKCEEKGRHTAVETCGYAEWGVVERIAPLVDLFLYDLKVMAPEAHVRLTGRDNRPILANAERLARGGHGLVLRLPLIGGVNDSEANLTATAEFARSLPGVTRIDLLPYHRLGEPKYGRLARDYPLAGRPAFPEERVAWAKGVLEAGGLTVHVGG